MSSYELRSALKAAGKTSSAFYLGILLSRSLVGEESCNYIGEVPLKRKRRSKPRRRLGHHIRVDVEWTNFPPDVPNPSG